MFQFEKKNIKLEKEEYAYLDIGNGQPIIMVHGNMSSGVHYLPLIDVLKHNYRCIAPDLRGFGDSSYNCELSSMDELADDLAQFMDALSINQAYFICWSAGCPVTLLFAAKHPERVKSIFAIEGGSHKGYPIYKKNKEFKSLFGKAYESKAELAKDPVQVAPVQNMLVSNNVAGMSSLWDAVIYTVNKPPKEDAEIYIKETMKQRCIVDLDWALSNVNMSHEYTAARMGDGRIDNIQCPCAFTMADRDYTVPPWMVMENVNAIKGAKLLSYVNCGHSPLVDCIDRLAQDVMQFIYQQ
ncbi:MAG: alpha/beta hydrolase [Clostridia bacterium]|nr:alpha/beta hydrolase [Clostridia bacterium]